MHVATSTALAVKELDPGQFHWILLEEEPSGLDEGLVYTPETISEPYPDADAAWVACARGCARRLDPLMS